MCGLCLNCLFFAQNISLIGPNGILTTRMFGIISFTVTNGQRQRQSRRKCKVVVQQVSPNIGVSFDAWIRSVCVCELVSMGSRQTWHNCSMRSSGDDKRMRLSSKGRKEQWGWLYSIPLAMSWAVVKWTLWFMFWSLLLQMICKSVDCGLAMTCTKMTASKMIRIALCNRFRLCIPVPVSSFIHVMAVMATWSLLMIAWNGCLQSNWSSIHGKCICV